MKISEPSIKNIKKIKEETMCDLKSRDAFFTKSEPAKRFVDKVNEIAPFDDFDNVIEPSAGSGRILELLPIDKRIGLDIEPMHDEVLPGDFFDYTFPKGKTIVVGNPPFGKQGKLAVQFFNKCAQFADVIAFIIPRSFLKYRIQNQLDKGFGLYYTAVMNPASFTLGDKDHKVKCVAQVWARLEYADKLKEVDQLESWDPDVPLDYLIDVDNYQQKHGCYEKHETLF